MKNLKFWQGSKVGFILGILIGCILAAGIVYAAVEYILEVPSNVIIVEEHPGADCTIALFSDAAGTHRLTSLNWGEIPRGTTNILTRDWLGHRLYVKNLGNCEVTVKASIEMPSDIGYGGGGQTWLGIGDCREIGLWWHIDKEAPLGEVNFTTVFHSTLYK